MKTSRSRSLVRLPVLMAIVILACAHASALNRSALEQVAGLVEHRTFALKATLREPVIRGGEMQVPTLTTKGWVHVSDSRNLVLSAGTMVEVTGVFDYAERGMFLEVAQVSSGFFTEPITQRPRLRIRLMVDASIDDPGAQAEQAIALIGRVLALSAS